MSRKMMAALAVIATLGMVIVASSPADARGGYGLFSRGGYGPGGYGYGGRPIPFPHHYRGYRWW
jgi:hypothetical protein